MSRSLQNKRQNEKDIKSNLALIQDIAFDLNDNDKALILESTIKSWRALKKLVDET